MKTFPVFCNHFYYYRFVIGNDSFLSEGKKNRGKLCKETVWFEIGKDTTFTTFMAIKIILLFALLTTALTKSIRPQFTRQMTITFSNELSNGCKMLTYSVAQWVPALANKVDCCSPECQTNKLWHCCI